ncbi:hypothetical protein [Pengzhenrongella sp.]|uniref:hypothetical protein n=1 Tax=Pengzhenrongella sp. TaxID=2888820 RepID=UPI002F946BBF
MTSSPPWGSADLNTAAAWLGFSTQTIRRAIRKTVDDGVFPPPLSAKRTPGGYRILAGPAQAWLESLPDAP